MKTIYRVDYSPQIGYYVQTEESVVAYNYKSWAKVSIDDDGETVSCEDESIFNLEDGWRESEEEALEHWRSDGIGYAASLIKLANKIEDIARNRTPIRLTDRIMKPEIP
jgi:hypothetical protein